MTLRHSLLAVLTLGPAYGYQLHGEVVERTRRTPDAPLIAVSMGKVTRRSTSSGGMPCTLTFATAFFQCRNEDVLPGLLRAD